MNRIPQSNGGGNKKTSPKATDNSRYAGSFVKRNRRRIIVGREDKSALNIKVPQTLLYEYDFMQKNNLFGLDMLYRKMPKKAFIKGKKQEIEGILMYCYCCEYYSEDQYWREYSEKLL